MAMPPDHKALLNQHDFVVPAESGVSDGDRLLLLRYGRWLSALASGQIAALTPEQERFVRVAHGKETPTSEYERAWVAYLRTRSAAPLSQRENGPIGPMEAAGCLDRLVEARRESLRLSAEHQRLLAALLAPVQTQLDALDAEYANRRAALLESVQPQVDALAGEYEEKQRTADERVSELDQAARQAVVAVGESIKHPEVHAVYVRGRVSWDSKGLSRYAETHPEVNEFRTVGAPSVQMRYQAEGNKE